MDALELSAWLRNVAAAVRPASLPVLLAIMDDALSSPDSIARVSIATLAGETRASSNTVQRAVADLCSAGVLVRAESVAGRVPGYSLGDLASGLHAISGPIRKDPLTPIVGGAKSEGGQQWGAPNLAKTYPKNDVLATLSGAQTKDIESTCLPAEQEGRGTPKTIPVASQTGDVEAVWTRPPPGDAGRVWEALAMANVGNPVRSELCVRLTLAQAREVIQAARDRGKLPWQLVLDLRERAAAEQLRETHRARVASLREKSQTAAASVLAAKTASDAAERAAIEAAIVAIDAAPAGVVERAARDVLASKGEHIAAMVTKRGVVSPSDAARHPRIAVDVSRLLAERSGLHVEPAGESA